MGGSETHDDVLRTERAGALVIRGGVLRGLGFVAAMGIGAGTSVFLFRGLGVADLGRYGTVAALLAIVSTVSDAGLTALGVRDYALRRGAGPRAALLEQLIALRGLLSALGIALAVLFALVAGYDGTMVAGAALGGIGVLLVNVQATMMTPLSVDLRLGRITVLEVSRSIFTFIGVCALSLAGATLLPYFGVQVAVGLLVLALTPTLVPAGWLRPRLRRSEALPLVREAAPIGIGLAMNVIYLRALVVMVSLTAGSIETGLYTAAFRVVELFVIVPPVLIGVALPLLSVAAAEDRERLRLGLQGLTETVLVASLGFALVIAVLARPALELLGGADYVGGAEMLQIQIWALVPLAAGSVLAYALFALGRQRDIAVANAAVVAAVLTGGLALVLAYEGVGAAVTGIVAEVLLLSGLALALRRVDPALVPRFTFAWRPLVALGAASATLLVDLPSWVDGAVAGSVFVVVGIVVGAVPREILVALARRAPGDRGATGPDR